MIFEPKLEVAVLQKRYKRFLADVNHPDLGDITVHCPNTGSMKNCWQEGWQVWLQKSDNPKRKYPYTWVLAKNDQDELIGINTHFANQLVFDGIEENKVTQIADVKQIKKEVKYGEENSRIDILVTHNDLTKTYIEVKSVTLKGTSKDNDIAEVDYTEGAGYFPDAVTIRGQKHVRELMACVEQGHNAILLFMVQHTGIETVSIAQHIDPEYAELIKQAIKKGVQVVAYTADISTAAITLEHEIPFIL